MRQPLPALRRFLLCLAFLPPVPALEARIGESRSELERRLIRQSDRGLEVDDDDLEEFHKGRSPWHSHVELLDGMEYIVYYKINEDVIPTSTRLWKRDRQGRRSDQPDPRPDGWLLHVVYLNGISVLEYYQRSKPLTPIEVEGILERNAGDSEWLAGGPDKNDKQAIQPQVFPVNRHRKDLAVYGHVAGDAILLFDPRLDERVNLRKMEQAREEAPASLDGF